MKRKRSKNNSAQVIFLAKDVAELVIRHYPQMTLNEVKKGLMSAEQFVIEAMRLNRKEGPR